MSDGPEDGYQSALARSAFYSIASGTLFLYENAIKATIGREALMEWAGSWAERNLPRGSTLVLRGDALIIDKIEGNGTYEASTGVCIRGYGSPVALAPSFSEILINSSIH